MSVLWEAAVMRNLLSSGFYRLWKNKVFWIGVIAMLVISAGIMLNGSRQAAALITAGYNDQTLDSYYFNLAPVIGLFCAILASLFIGTEYSEGTLRNKIVVGRTRTAVYLANYVICLAAGVCFVAAWLIGGLTGLPALGLWKMGIDGALLYAVIAIFFTAAFTGIFTLLSMLSSNKAVTAVIAILLALGLILVASTLYNKLCEPELSSGVIITADGLQKLEPAPNPDYVGGVKRTIYQFIVDSLPSGQGILMANQELGRPILSLISSVAISLITTIAGVLAFRKKDLN